MSLMMISMIMVMLVLSLESVNRICEVLVEEPTIKNPENPIYEVVNGDVDFNNVNFKYKKNSERNALDNINIHIKSGQFVGILGSTGSGKTSVINLISRLYDATEGEVKVADHNVKEYDLETLRDNVAVVLQKNVLFSGTIESNLRWGNLNATEEEMWAACKIAQAEEIVKAKPELLSEGCCYIEADWEYNGKYEDEMVGFCLDIRLEDSITKLKVQETITKLKEGTYWDGDYGFAHNVQKLVCANTQNSFMMKVNFLILSLLLFIF